MRLAKVEIGTSVEWLADGIVVKRSAWSSGRATGLHVHPIHAITVLLSDPGPTGWRFGDLKADGELAVGQVFVCPAGVEASVRWERPSEFVSVGLTPAGLSRIVGTVSRHSTGGIRPAVGRDDPFLRHLVLALAEETDRMRAGRERVREALTLALGLHLLQDYADAADRRQAAGLSGDDLSRLRRHIDENLDTDLSLARLAAVAHLSRFHFARLFKSATGLTPHRYIIRRRVERAAELLQAGRSIAQVAAAVGFASQSHLAHHVRRVFDCTPAELARGRRDP